MGVPQFNTPAGGYPPANIQINFTSLETPELLSYQMLKPHDCIFIRLDTTPECDGQMDRQNSSS